MRPRVGDVYTRDWGSHGVSIFKITVMYGPLAPMSSPMATAEVIDDFGPPDLSLRKRTISMMEVDFAAGGKVSFVSRQIVNVAG